MKLTVDGRHKWIQDKQPLVDEILDKENLAEVLTVENLLQKRQMSKINSE